MRLSAAGLACRAFNQFAPKNEPPGRAVAPNDARVARDVIVHRTLNHSDVRRPGSASSGEKQLRQRRLIRPRTPQSEADFPIQPECGICFFLPSDYVTTWQGRVDTRLKQETVTRRSGTRLPASKPRHLKLKTTAQYWVVFG